MELKNIASLLLFITLSACSSYNYISKPLTKEINIDGNIEDWNGNLKYFNQAKSAVGIANDSEYLYMAFTTGNKANIFRIMKTGLIIWFEPEDGKKIGLQYPLINTNEMEDYAVKNSFNKQRRKHINIFPSKKFKEFRIVNKDKFPLSTYNIASSEDIQLAMSINNSVLSYELKIPLNGKAGNYRAIQANAGETLDVILETLPLERKKKLNPGNMRSGNIEGRQRRMGGMNRNATTININDADIDIELEVTLNADMSAKNND